MTSDWLQGPYVYALYASYGFSGPDIAHLFVAGFGSSMVFGTFIGALADRIGRKHACVWYCITYILSCITKHFKQYYILMLGRILGGIATSLLFSAFESWMICEHNKRQYESKWISITFSNAIFGNGILAILAGLLAEKAASFKSLSSFDGNESSVIMWGGYCSPFDLSMVFLMFTWVALHSTWTENYGDKHGSGATSAFSSTALASAWKLIRSDPVTMHAGFIQSTFEGSMYTFVFMWTPVLTPTGSDPPYGLIFASFMLSCMCGSKVYALLNSRFPVEKFTIYVYLVAAIALSIPVFTESIPLIVFGFLIFECCVGIYFPAMGTIKGTYVPEESRAAIYNLYRVPLNMIVLCVLLTDASTKLKFCACSAMLVMAAWSGYCLHSHSLAHPMNPVVQARKQHLDEIGVELLNHSNDIEKELR
uniref:Molybdate-anion transporter n=1 Tax=Octactis speculum TaxID=3111310 RepID=A0A7S2GQP7_9STRA|eukprot:CAMPEP_0185793472 /NCGR_PEP_ID=MMETSP1174-20130828/159491_1 /TAXON_ID=35687 /ORGANISM="Dictyocha speculum, Strain CCMP1381" /LENGTH=421 /DNA_ID=CAMNT_0028488623 /DNA_START=148 /DNA_END=1413 /DNA_ORIENTATION=+